MSWLRKLRGDTSGVTIVEFALIAPIFCMTLMGALDMAHNMYTKSLLQGGIQKAARDSTIEGASAHEAEMDARVTEIVQDISPEATLTFNRMAYSTFSDMGQPEDYTEVGDNPNLCDGGETFEDANGNGVWDQDRGTSGFGGARDATLYTVNVSYPRLFPIAAFIGQSQTMTLKASTVLRNQPFDAQSAPAPTTGTCS